MDRLNVRKSRWRLFAGVFFAFSLIFTASSALAQGHHGDRPVVPEDPQEVFDNVSEAVAVYGERKVEQIESRCDRVVTYIERIAENRPARAVAFGERQIARIANIVESGDRRLNFLCQRGVAILTDLGAESLADELLSICDAAQADLADAFEACSAEIQEAIDGIEIDAS